MNDHERMICEIPRLKIKGWEPGTCADMPVRIVNEATGSGFLSDVPLATARFIVACVNECARQQEMLNVISRPLMERET